MEIHDYSKISQCYINGYIERSIETFMNDILRKLQNKEKEIIHPKEIERRKRLGIETRTIDALLDRVQNEYSQTSAIKRKGNCPFNDSVIIVSGNCGIGSKSEGYYISLFEKFNNALKINNCNVLLMRGNADDPSYFSEGKINLSNIKTIKDYSVIKFKHYNCLCIGGAISMDRKWKIIQGERLGRKLYWEDEGVKYDENALNEIIQNYDIGCVVTCSCPSFVFPGTNSFRKSKWINNDKELIKDLTEERNTMDKIYHKIIETNKKPYVWAYGRFGVPNKSNINDIVFFSMELEKNVSLNQLISNNFGIDINKNLSDNKASLDEFMGTWRTTITYNSNLEMAHEDAIEEDDADGFGVFEVEAPLMQELDREAVPQMEME